jgi:hypothetical protein
MMIRFFGLISSAKKSGNGRSSGRIPGHCSVSPPSHASMVRAAMASIAPPFATLHVVLGWSPPRRSVLCMNQARQTVPLPGMRAACQVVDRSADRKVVARAGAWPMVTPP